VRLMLATAAKRGDVLDRVESGAGTEHARDACGADGDADAGVSYFNGGDNDSGRHRFLTGRAFKGGAECWLLAGMGVQVQVQVQVKVQMEVEVEVGVVG